MYSTLKATRQQLQLVAFNPSCHHCERHKSCWRVICVGGTRVGSRQAETPSLLLYWTAFSVEHPTFYSRCCMQSQDKFSLDACTWQRGEPLDDLKLVIGVALYKHSFRVTESFQPCTFLFCWRTGHICPMLRRWKGVVVLWSISWVNSQGWQPCSFMDTMQRVSNVTLGQSVWLAG